MLTTDSIVKISLNLTALTGSRANFGTGLIIGTSTALGEERMKRFDSLASVGDAGFAEDSEEYKAATLYFAQTPKADGLWIGRKLESESYSEAVVACMNANMGFWGVYLIGASASDCLDVETKLNAYERCMLFAQVGVENATQSGGLLDSIQKRGSRRATVLVSGQTHAAAAVMGVCAGNYVSHTAVSFALCYKSLASVETDNLDAGTVDAIEAMNGNVYVTRGYDFRLYEHAATGSGLRVDEMLYLDAMIDELKTEGLNLIANSSDRLPQSDSTSGRFKIALTRVLRKYSGMLVIGAGEWRGSTFGTLKNGDYLDNGYYIHIAPYVEQSISDRAAHKAMPINICCILAGGVESVQISVNVQQ